MITKIITLLLIPIISFLVNTTLSSDDDYVVPTKKIFFFLIVMQEIFGIIIAFLNYNTKFSCIYILALVPLTFITYTDLQSKQIYVMVNYLLFILGIISITTYIYTSKQILSVLIAIFFYSLIVIIEYKLKLFGKGDTRTLLFLQLILITIQSKRIVLLFEPMLWHMFIAIIIFLIRNIKKVNWKTLRLKSKEPFGVDIAISYLLIIIFCGL